MRHDEIQELLASYALDALDADEVSLIEAHLPTCPRCRAELANYREVAAHLSYAGEPAPAGLWDGIVASMQARPPALRLTSAEAATVRRRSVSVRLFSVAAGVAALVIATLGIEVAHLNARTNGLNREIASGAITRAYQKASTTPGAVHVSLRGSGAPAPVPAVLLADGVAYIDATALPHLDKDQTYQLWGIPASGAPVSLAVLGAAPSVRQFGAPTGMATLAVTIEQGGGAVVPQGAPVLSSPLSG